MIIIYTSLAILVLPLCFIFYHIVVRKPRPPFDDTNRFNRARIFFWSYSRPYLFKSLGYSRTKLIWKALTMEEDFAHFFSWIQYDEWDNMK